jgi:hypothetical protein
MKTGMEDVVYILQGWLNLIIVTGPPVEIVCSF